MAVVEGNNFTIGDEETPRRFLIFDCRFLIGAAGAGVDEFVIGGVRGGGGGLEVFAGTVAGVDEIAGAKFFEGGGVKRLSFALRVGTEGAANVGAFLPLETKPAEVFGTWRKRTRVCSGRCRGLRCAGRGRRCRCGRVVGQAKMCGRGRDEADRSARARFGRDTAVVEWWQLRSRAESSRESETGKGVGVSLAERRFAQYSKLIIWQHPIRNQSFGHFVRFGECFPKSRVFIQLFPFLIFILPPIRLGAHTHASIKSLPKTINIAEYFILDHPIPTSTRLPNPKSYSQLIHKTASLIITITMICDFGGGVNGVTNVNFKFTSTAT